MANGQDSWPLMDTQHYCCWTWPDLLIVDKLLWMSENCCLSKQRRVCEYTFRPWFRTVAPYTEQRVQTKRCNIKMDFLFSATIWKVYATTHIFIYFCDWEVGLMQNLSFTKNNTFSKSYMEEYTSFSTEYVSLLTKRAKLTKPQMLSKPEQLYKNFY